MGTYIKYCFEKKNDQGNWIRIGSKVIKNPTYEIGKDYPLFSLLANVRNDYNIIPFPSSQVSSYEDREHIIYLSDMLSYDWGNRFAYYEYRYERDYLNPSPLSYSCVGDIKDYIVYDEVEYWGLRNKQSESTLSMLPAENLFIIRIIESHIYSEYFEEFYENIVDYMKSLDDDPSNVRFVCSFN